MIPTRDAFLEHCSGTLSALKREGRYREFARLEKQAGRFPIYIWHGGQGSAGSRGVVVQRLSRHGQPSGGARSGCNRALRSYGAGAGGTRNISGTSPLHAALEAELAALHAKPGALLFGSGYIANQAALSAVLSALPGFIVFSDAKNHASMIAGMRGAAAGVQRHHLPSQRPGASGRTAACRRPVPHRS